MLNLLEHACATAWAIDRTPDAEGREYPVLRTMLDIAARENLDLEAVEAKRAARLPETEGAGVRDGVAIIPISGPIFRHANMFTNVSGATSIETTATDFTAAVNNPRVKGVLLSIDSPGGTVNGTNELAKMVAQARAESGKPIAAYVSAMGASGAYWIASAVGPGNLFVDDTAMVGSIGIAMASLDTRARDAARGIREVKFISSQSPNKQVDPMTEEGAAVLQARVDKMAEIFIGAVARNRGVTAETVMTDFGQGDVLMGQQAINAGMADAISTFEGVLADLAGGRLGASRPTASVGQVPRSAAPRTSPATSLPPLTSKETTMTTTTTDPATKDEADWASDPNIRAEFGGDKESYMAYRRGCREGRIREPRPTVSDDDFLPTVAGGRQASAAQSTSDPMARAEQIWIADPAVRGEFGDKAVFLAYARSIVDGLSQDTKIAAALGVPTWNRRLQHHPPAA